MSVLLQILLATVLVSLLSLLGIVSLFLRERALRQSLLVLVALSAGVLMGGAFFHLLPEALEAAGAGRILGLAVVGFSGFYLIERLLRWHHFHHHEGEVHAFAYMNLVGEAVHNFLDGLLIAASFVASPALGLTTTVAVALHEIPQEIGDFGVLLHGGFSRNKALVVNFLSALMAILGGLIGYSLSQTLAGWVPALVALTAGGFIYIAASDLLPEIREETGPKSLLHFLVFLVGLAATYGLAGLE